MVNKAWFVESSKWPPYHNPFLIVLNSIAGKRKENIMDVIHLQNLAVIALGQKFKKSLGCKYHNIVKCPI